MPKLVSNCVADDEGMNIMRPALRLVIDGFGKQLSKDQEAGKHAN